MRFTIITQSVCEFEKFLKNLFEKMGYAVEETKLSGDQGADLVINKFSEKLVFQAKRYGCEKVSNSAIQEVVAAIRYYNANKGTVVTTSTFTKSAIELARSNGVDLIDRTKLDELIHHYFYKRGSVVTHSVENFNKIYDMP